MFQQPKLKVPETIQTKEELDQWVFEQIDREQRVSRLLNILPALNDFQEKKHVLLSENILHDYQVKIILKVMERGLFYKQSTKELGPKAIEIFKRVLKIEPINALACFRLGHLMNKNEDVSDAIGYFAKALDFSWNSAFLNMRVEYKLQGYQVDLAKRLLLGLTYDLLKYSPDGTEILLNSAEYETFRELLINPVDNFVVHIVRDKNKVQEGEIIRVERYDDYLYSSKIDRNELIIDRFESTPKLRYLGQPREMFYSEREHKLKYLLIALGLEERMDIPGSNVERSRERTTLRLNDDFRRMGIDPTMLQISYTGSGKFEANCAIKIHYFKRIFH